jgi:hypothetical protein
MALRRGAAWIVGKEPSVSLLFVHGAMCYPSKREQRVISAATKVSLLYGSIQLITFEVQYH